MSARPTLLLVVPLSWAGLWTGPLGEAGLTVLVHDRDSYAPEDVDYVLGFRPAPGFLKTLPKVKAIFSLGAGVDGFLSDPEFPKQIPLIRFVDPQLSTEMAQYVVLHTLLHHRRFKEFEALQAQSKWQQMLPLRPTSQTRIGILGLGEIGTVSGERLRDLGFPVAGWSRTRKTVDGIRSYAGEAEMAGFLAASDIMICLLPLTPETRGILNAKLFAGLPRDAYVINVARGGHLVEADLVAALDSGHLAGAALDVFETEPLPSDNPLWKHPKIIVTPHIAAITEPATAARSVISGIALLERGETHPNTVDMSRGY